jgi:hypothetical protein
MTPSHTHTFLGRAHELWRHYSTTVRHFFLILFFNCFSVVFVGRVLDVDREGVEEHQRDEAGTSLASGLYFKPILTASDPKKLARIKSKKARPFGISYLNVLGNYNEIWKEHIVRLNWLGSSITQGWLLNDVTAVRWEIWMNLLRLSEGMLYGIERDNGGRVCLQLFKKHDVIYERP